MVIVFSGFRDDVLKAQIEAAGGKVAVSLVKAATHLLTKRDAKASKKAEEAKEKGLEIVFLDDFIEEHEFNLGEHKPRGRPAAKKVMASDDEKGTSDEEVEPAKPTKATKPTKMANNTLERVNAAIEQLQNTLIQLEKLKADLL